MSEGKWHLNGEAIIINDKVDTLDDFWNKVSTSTLPLYTSGRNRLLSVRGQDKQKVVTDLWNKYISSKENIRVNITSAIIFK